MERQGKKSLATEARHQVWIMRKIVQSDGEGGQIEIWVKNKQAFCAINPIKAWQRFRDKTVGVDTTHIFRFRGGIDIQEADTIDFNGRNFEILTVENIQERNFELIVTCQEKRT
jgi:SPP1 family predicted phage head-tail adaptor